MSSLMKFHARKEIVGTVEEVKSRKVYTCTKVRRAMTPYTEGTNSQPRPTTSRLASCGISMIESSMGYSQTETSSRVYVRIYRRMLESRRFDVTSQNFRRLKNPTYKIEKLWEIEELPGSKHSDESTHRSKKSTTSRTGEPHHRVVRISDVHISSIQHIIPFWNVQPRMTLSTLTDIE